MYNKKKTIHEIEHTIDLFTFLGEQNQQNNPSLYLLRAN